MFCAGVILSDVNKIFTIIQVYLHRNNSKSLILYWIIHVAAFVDLLGILNISQTTNMTNEKKSESFVYPTPIKRKTNNFVAKSYDSAATTNCYNIESDCDREFIFHT